MESLKIKTDNINDFVHDYKYNLFDIKHLYKINIKKFSIIISVCAKICCFFYIFSHDDIIDVINYSKELLYTDNKNYNNYKILWKETPIKILHINPFKNTIQSLYLEYNNIINKLNMLQNIKKQFIISKYNECLKYIDYAEEEYSCQENLLLSLSKINKYYIDIDILITNIIMSSVQKHTFCISTELNIDINSFIFEIHDNLMIYESIKSILFTDDFYFRFKNINSLIHLL